MIRGVGLAVAPSMRISLAVVIVSLRETSSGPPAGSDPPHAAAATATAASAHRPPTYLRTGGPQSLREAAPANVTFWPSRPNGEVEGRTPVNRHRVRRRRIRAV